MKNRLFLNISLALCLGVFSSIFLSSSSIAAPAGWQAGNIINDAVFTNTNTMSVGQIQTFLNSKNPTCDTWGTKTSEYGGGTRAQYGASRGNPAPFTCLKDYKEGGKTSSQIIYDASQEFRINPQVFLVLLQKEQGLITDEWPFAIQYRTATGYGCPDTAPCDAQYYGLTNQIRWAGRMFRSILDANPNWYTPYILGNNYIQYNPNAACGGSTVNIQNRATQALYNYTPYQPNQGALDAGWGTANCGAYGNRNFYLYFTEWFGNTHSNRYSPMLEKRVMTIDTSSIGNNPTYKINPDTGEVYPENPLNNGMEIYFYSRTNLEDGSTCLRTKIDTENNANRCIKIARTKEWTPIFQNLTGDEVNVLASQFTFKVDFKHDINQGDYGIQAGQPITFAKKITVAGQTFYVTQKDYSENNQWRGVKAERIKKLSTLFENLQIPRYMHTNSQTKTIDLSTGSEVENILDPNTHFYFDKKVSLGDKIYYTSNYLRTLGQYYAISSTNTSDGISFQPFLIPRNMKLNTDTYKYSLDTNSNADDLLLNGRVIQFSQKININNKDYFRTISDKNNGYNKVIESIKLSEIQ